MWYTVEVKGLGKAFNGLRVLVDVDLTVETGSVLALLGPNGAGKTTLIRILATLVRPDTGTATIAGHDLGTDPVGVKRSVSLTGQFAAVDDVLTGQENLEMMAHLRHLPRREVRARTQELLAEFGLLEARHRRAATYSGGMRRRLDLAISMITRPELMFLDEPSTGLDPRSREQLWATVRGLVDQGVTILLTTQYLEEADQLADRIAVLDRGRIVARGTPDELKTGLGRQVLRLQFADPAAYGRAIASIGPACTGLAQPPLPERRRVLEISTDGSSRDVLSLLRRLDDAGAPAVSVSTHRPSLADVFLTLISAGQEATEATEAIDAKEYAR